MATKTIAIMDDVYHLLVQHKQQDESFSDELRRILSKRKTKSLRDYFGIISDEKGEAMLKDLEKFREVNRISLRKRLS